MTLSITPQIVPTGGAILFDFTALGTVSPGSPMTFSRATSVSGVVSAFVPLYTGDALALFIDAGDGLPQPLTATTAYVYRLQDPTGTVLTAALVPGGEILVEPDVLTSLIIRLLQAGVTNLIIPDGVTRAVVSNAMPLTGFPPLPFVVVNLDLIQQENVPIGQNVVNPDGDNVWTQASYAKRIWRVSILARSADERNFYVEALTAIFQSMLGSIFAALGSNMSHRYQVASGQTADEYQGKSPGFFFADLMMEVLGVFNTSIQTSFGRIEAITTATGLPDGQIDHTQVGTPSAPV